MKIIITESQLKTLVKETTKDRHREGYYKEYNERRKAQGLPTDRHRDGYYEEYNELHPDRKKKDISNKNGTSKKKDRHRPGYYHEYNKKHPERLNRGFTRGYKDGCVDNGYKYDDAITGFNDDEAFGPGFPNLSDEDYDNAWEYEDGYRMR